MTVISSLFSGISGIIANGSALSVAGDNIANMNTPGFKSSTPVFESALAQRIGEAEVGLGSRLAGTSVNFAQGGFANTTNATDLAIEGKGFFIVQNAGGDSFYTRAGLFEQDSDGALVTSAGGFTLQGYEIDDAGLVGGSLTPINFSTVNSAPERTGSIEFAMTLDSGTPINTSTADWSSNAGASASSDFSYSQTVYDNQGIARTIDTYFRKTADNTWVYRSMTAASNLSNASTMTEQDYPIVVAKGTLVFDTDGTLLSQTDVSAGNESVAGLFTDAVAAGSTLGEVIATQSVARGIRWTGTTDAIGTNLAANEIGITHDFGDVGADATTTQFDTAESTIKTVTQDGRGPGTLTSIEVGSDGTIQGNFSNGSSRDLFKVPIATFKNENGLSRIGTNLYQASGTSGLAQPGLANSEGRGKIRSFVTENSNVDLATEFVKIITFQRAFQASSRTVSTAAELLQDLVRLGQ